MTEIPGYKFSFQTRTKNQIDLSVNITKVLTELNLKRQPKEEKLHPKKQSLFICLPGLSYFETQFKNLDLPGQVIVKRLSGFDINLSEEQLIECWKKSSFEYEAKKIYDQIQEKGKGKDILLVYHSFGSYVGVTFMHLYPNVKIKGIIDLGGIPLRFYRILHDLVITMPEPDMDFLFQEREALHLGYLNLNQGWKKRGVIVFPFTNKYETIIFIKFIASKWFKTMFYMHRNIPKVLKLICFGSKDGLFETKLLSQKAIHFSYKTKLDEEYERELLTKYERVFGQKVKNIQERFVFNFQGAGHSLHMQQKFVPQVKKVIREYLRIISTQKE